MIQMYEQSNSSEALKYIGLVNRFLYFSTIKPVVECISFTLYLFRIFRAERAEVFSINRKS